jgi:cysteinyl-tRNA synthetase
MALRVYNSLIRKKEEFIPIHKGKVNMYVCGPTVYDYPHIGHAKSYISFDIIVRYLRYLGYKVRYVQNITDVGHLLDSGEDRIMKGAKRESVEPMELVERYTKAYFDAMDALNVLRPDISPHAAAHIPEQIELVEKLIAKGYAYEINGSVYFDVTKWAQYGKLSGRKIEDQQAGARLEINSEKKHPADFALWKNAKAEHIMQWNSPWGRGYPGWHAECSAMSMKYLGESIDIHGGGIENQFPHHECEIAQSEAVTGKPFVKYWFHNNMVLVDSVKMSKSLGNFTTVSDALNKFTGDQIRFFILQTHYRSTVDFSDASILASTQGLEKLRITFRNLQTELQAAKSDKVNNNILELADKYKLLFEQQMNDDFNTPAAIGSLFDFSREINRTMDDTKLSKENVVLLYTEFKRQSQNVLGLKLGDESTHQSAAPFLDLLLELRDTLRAKKEWELSDKIRDKISENGVVVEDGKEGSRWRML